MNKVVIKKFVRVLIVFFSSLLFSSKAKKTFSFNPLPRCYHQLLLHFNIRLLAEGREVKREEKVPFWEGERERRAESKALFSASFCCLLLSSNMYNNLRLLSLLPCFLPFLSHTKAIFNPHSLKLLLSFYSFIFGPHFGVVQCVCACVCIV